MLSQVIDLIEKHDRFAITSHIRPDGDSLGSSLALCWILRGLNKNAEVVMCDQVPMLIQSSQARRTSKLFPMSHVNTTQFL